MNSDKEKATLLVVDDAPYNLKILLTYLHTRDFKVIMVQSGAEALEKAAQAKPDLILLDIMMPDMDGFETCRRLKQDPATQDIPVIFMTALASVTDKLKAFSSGGVDYVTKPLQHEELLARVNTHLKLRSLQKTLELQNQETHMFLHTMANGLKIPLLRMSELNGTLSKDALKSCNPQVLEMLEEIQHTHTDMLNTLNAMLLLMSLRFQHVPNESLRMGEVVRRVLERMQPLLDRYQAQVGLPETWPVAQGYFPWVEEIWVTFLSNALKYGGRPPLAQFGAETLDNGMLRFWLKDNGKGIKPEQQAHLFAPISQLQYASDYSLSLPMACRMLEKCGGEVGVESVSGGGSCFYFTLPAA